MKYTLTVTSYEPLTEEEKKEMAERKRYNGIDNFNRQDVPFSMREVRNLIVQLDENEFAAVKKAVIEVMK